MVFNYAPQPREPFPDPVPESDPAFEDSVPQFHVAPTSEDEDSGEIKSKRRQPHNMIFEGKLIVDGYIAGAISSAGGELVLEASGEIVGTISVSSAIIRGCVRGNIRALDTVELDSTACVIGDIETAELRIRSPAVFKGECTFPQDSAILEDEFVELAIDELEELAFAIGR